MGFKNLNHTNMRFLIVAALCAIASAAPEGRRLRPEEHWRPAQGRDLSKYKPRAAMVDANGDALMEKINRVAAEMRAASPSNKKDLGKPKAACGIEGPAIMAGAHNVRESSEPNRVEVTSYNGWTHPLWNSNDLSGDLALIELPSPLPMNDYISTSCLPATGEPPAVGSLVTVTGWGKPSDSAGGISPVLREVRDIPVMTNADCNAVYGIVGDGVVCIDTAGGRGSCNGDSGGPLVQKAGGKAAGDQWTQVGIVSFGASAGCEVGMPAGFTRTEYYLDWIRSETGMP